VTQELEQLSHEIMDAIRTRNRRALEAVLTADFVQIDELGHRLRKEPFIAAVEAGEFQIEKLWFESLSVEQFDETAVVSGVQRAQVRLPAGDRAEGRTAFTDVFVRTADGWRLRLATSAELALGEMP
jgi:ketosteroid isomerase-like protein